LIEHGSADLILIGGTVGMIDTTPEGDAMKLIHPDTRTQPTTLWVLKQYLSTPTQAITNFFKRLRYVIGLNYLLFTLALLGFYARRKEKSTHCLALVSLYFICLHCLFATLAYLYEPLWPLLCAMSSLVVAHPKSRSNLWQSISRKILNLSLSALIIGALYCQYIVIRYTVNSTQRAPESEEALNHALQRMPKDPLLLLEKARSQIAQGKIEQAQITIDQIAPGTPPLPRIELERNRIAFHRGEINVISPPIQQPAFDDDVTIRFLLYRALEASNDDTALATKTITQACQYWNKQQRLTEVRDSQEEDWQKHLRQNSDNALAQYATSIFYRMPIHRWLKPLAIAAAVGSVSFSKELALILQSNGYPHDACTLIQEIQLSNSTNPELWRDLGVCHYLDNNLKQAFAALQKSYALDSRSPATVLSLGSVMTQMGQSKSALNLYKESLSQRPKHSEGPLWVLIEDNLRKNTH
jgi:tetratricopeptide (TPR) repeat protein